MVDSTLTDNRDASKAARLRKPLAVSCSVDPDREATFYCARCHKAFCEGCVGHERGRDTYCLQCSVALEGQQDEEASRRQSSPVPGRFRGMALYLLVAAAFAGIAFNGFQIYRNHQQSAEPAAAPATVSPQLAGIAACRHRLQILAAAVTAYRDTFERNPDTIEELQPLLVSDTPITDPVSHRPYILNRTANNSVTIRCPEPEAHGVASIEVRPGAIARVVYSRQTRAGQ